MKTNDIRHSFLHFFEKRDHRVVPSSPVIPFNDPTILFANAGMNQFKDVFTGQRKVDYRRAASSQKCIRAGGKHNDLDNVGFTARHHTFFEMLGNFSFGDYFKEQAILYAWEWITKELKMPKDRLHVTVFETDDEAFGLWEKIAPELKNGRILRFGKKDNFWSMGDTGPCGPNSEINFDRGEEYGTGPEDIVNGETERFIEFWNLVFMQFDQQLDGTLIPLPKPSVDTGAGLERLACLLQDVETNYGIDLFQALIAGISDITHTRYRDHVASHHVIADHVRALTFAVADGAGISNEGRGYVLRRVLRRAARHGRQLGAHEPFIYRLVPVLVEQMGEAYPEISEKQSHIMNVVRTEEEAFGRTLETGLELFESVAKRVKGSGSLVVDGETAFKLYDTYGFPYDLTEILATENGLTVDQVGFDQAMKQQQERSRAGGKFVSYTGKMLIEIRAGLQPTRFVRGLDSIIATVLQVSSPVREEETGATKMAVVLDQSPFYLEAGGQIGDCGTIQNAQAELAVERVFEQHGNRSHTGMLIRGEASDFAEGAQVTVRLDLARRWDIMRNHTATHLMHAALRRVVGDHVHQSGSYVGPDRLRFDFSHHQPLTPDEIRDVEELVNEQILKGTKVETVEMPVAKAKESGAMALFGEKYGDTVRVVSVPGFSKELCGGTHVDNAAQIGPFFVTLETGVASGVRRIEAITGREAQIFMLDAKQFRRQAAHIIGRPESEALSGLEQLREEYAALQKELKKTKQEMFSGGAKSVGEELAVGPLTVITHDFGATDKDTIAAWLDTHKAKNKPLVVVGLGQVNGKITYLAAASSAAVDNHKIDIGELSRVLLAQFGGKGGGKANFAQGGVATDTRASDLFGRMRDLLSERLK